MNKPMITIHNCETNEVEVREMNADELAKWEADQAERAAEIVAKAEKEAARQALLAKLGITSDEAALLFP
jgi:ribosome-binding ATPase YchF (GTP1/OBG family)